MEKINCTSAVVNAFAYGDGGHVTASIVAKTEADALKLVEAIKGLVTVDKEARLLER